MCIAQYFYTPDTDMELNNTHAQSTTVYIPKCLRERAIMLRYTSIALSRFSDKSTFIIPRVSIYRYVT